MADTKISAMTALAQGDVVVGTDVLPIVDVGSPNLNKRITPQALVGSAVTDLVQTWNSAGTAFNAIKMNVTDTASAAGSLLLDLQVGGTSSFRVDKAGNVLGPSSGFSITAGSGRYISLGSSSGGVGIMVNDPGNNRIRLGSSANVAVGTGQFYLPSGTAFNWSSSANDPYASSDLILARDAANTLAQRNGTNAQAFRIYNTFTDASNYERGFARWVGNEFQIGVEAAGTGVGRTLALFGQGVLGLSLGSSTFNVHGRNLLFATDNTNDIGASGANRPRNVWIGGSVHVGDSPNSYIGPTNRSIFSSPSNGVILLSNWAVNDFGRLQFGGTTSSFPALKRSTTSLQVRLADDSADAPLTASTLTATSATVNDSLIAGSGYSLTGSSSVSMVDLAGTWNTSGTPTALKLNITDTASAAGSLLLDLQLNGADRFKIEKTGAFVAAQGSFTVTSLFNTVLWSGATFGWSSASGVTTAATADTVLRRDAANTLAQRNGTNAQTFRIYNTFTDASNYERGEVHWVSNVFRVGTYAAGTGTGRTLTFLTSGVERWSINAGNGHFLAVADNTYDIGASGANRPRNVFWAGYQEMSEMTAPAAPAANGVRIYAEDNGSGKTRLMALFATGVAQQIAIEP